MNAPNFDLIKEKLQPVFASLHVMVVDDMPMNIDSYRLILQGLGIDRGNISAATNGLKALTTINSTRPDLILSDWNMPVMDGLTFAKNLRKTELHKDIVLIMITAESEADLEDARPYVNAFLRKPVQNAVIEKMILSVVAKRVADPNHPMGKKR
ncbi:MAG: response regulator [Gammaproteobacteria bacterium]|jgi:CheY-like chemotaxis protein|nr:response regulator [Gammaproteobacteria bacterium]MBT7309037.1 response regulator [Gammaproteobacteria bacterium]